MESSARKSGEETGERVVFVPDRRQRGDTPSPTTLRDDALERTGVRMMKYCEDDDADQMRSENMSGVAGKTVVS